MHGDEKQRTIKYVSIQAEQWENTLSSICNSDDSYNFVVLIAKILHVYP